jgi:uracil-DNA glycosylase family 4
MNKKDLLSELYFIYSDFKNTSVYIDGAKNIVFGEGDPESSLMFIGEAPGAEEDILARPFVGRSGRLLTKVIESFGVVRSSVFITNIVKCRPPENRTPTPFEIEKGKNLILRHEIEIIKPKIIVTLGLSSLVGLLEQPYSMNRVRGSFLNSKYGIIFPTYHPAYVLRNSTIKQIFINDIEKALKESCFLM